MNQHSSLVLEIPGPAPDVSRDYMQAKLTLHTDSWDVAHDLEHGVSDIVVVDARSRQAYAKGHIPGALSFPHREMSPETTSRLDRDKMYVVYCDGIGCNESTKGAYKLAAAGLRVKELVGGLDFWIRDAHPVVCGDEAGAIAGALTVAACGCG